MIIIIELCALLEEREILGIDNQLVYSQHEDKSSSRRKHTQVWSTTTTALPAHMMRLQWSVLPEDQQASLSDRFLNGHVIWEVSKDVMSWDDALWIPPSIARSWVRKAGHIPQGPRRKELQISDH